MDGTPVYNKFNRGEIDALALARDDVKKTNNSCALMENFLPIRLGPMQYRPGFETLDTVLGEAYTIPFIASTTDTATLEFTNNALRIWIDDKVLTRVGVSSTITNPNFDTNLSGWSDNSGSGSSTAFFTGGFAALQGNRTTSAVLFQTISNTQIGVEHTLNITIARAPMTLKIGITGVSSDEIFSGVLLPGDHSLIFSPSANVTLTMENDKKYRTLVDSIDFASSGVQIFTTDITTAKLPSIRSTQSADVMFITHDNGKQIRVERRGTKSWSIVDYRVDDGPFGFINDSDITMTAAALDGDTTLTASSSYFKTGHVGTLFKLGSAGQLVQATVTAQDTGTNSIRVTGVGVSREFTITITALSGTSSTITLQRSTDDAAWTDVESYTTNQSKTFDDELDNSILFYRLHCKTGDYSSGTILLTLDFAGGSIEGIARVTAFTSTTVVDIQVLRDFGSTEATRDWFEGQWSDIAGYPTADSLYEGRLWFAGKSNIWGSISDNFISFDRDIEGDAQSILKTIGFGPVDNILWLADSSRMLMGLASDEISIRSSSFGEVLSPTNINLKPGTSQGAAPVAPIRIDEAIYFVQRSLIKIMEAKYSGDSDSHTSRDIMTLNQKICSAGIKRLAVSRQPETRIFVVLNNGEMRVYLIDPIEDVFAWSRITHASGTFEDVIVLPGLDEDRVYVVINRSGTRYLEKMAKLDDYIEKHVDSFKSYISPGNTVTGLDHLEGKTVNVWGDNKDRGDFVVSGGEITGTNGLINVTVGLRFNADYLSNKLGQYADYSVLTKRTRVTSIGMLVRDLWPGAIQHGPDFDNLDPMPLIENGGVVPTNIIIDEYDHTPFPFNGTHDTNSRVAIRATGPCTIMALVYEIKDSVNKTTKKK